jgi:hypothetical protein
MTSNLVGLCELARVTGDPDMLQAALNAWQDIVANRLYLTGSASQWEHFQADHVLRNDAEAHICETCVTVTWIQFNLELLRLTGESKFGDELERSMYNHLAAAQHPRGDDWCYYTALEDRKPYDKGITCCHSSGPRGLALAPQTAYLRGYVEGHDAMLVSTLETSSATMQLNGQTVKVEQQSEFPRYGRSVLKLHVARPATFAIQVRVPAWADPMEIKAGDFPVQSHAGHWATIPARTWKDGDQIKLSFRLASAVVQGDHGNAGRVALTWGPFAMAIDQKQNPGLPAPSTLALAASPAITLKEGSPLALSANVEGRTGGPRPATFSTFADAGSDGGTYRVWLRVPGAAVAKSDSLLADGVESRSRHGNTEGSILDGDVSSFVVTYDSRPAKTDWFAVTVDEPVTLGRVAFSHGKSFHDGGWFDSSGGKPRVEVQRTKGGRWEPIGTLADYPDTTATDAKGLKPGQTFTLRLPEPVKVYGVRVIGVPACGDGPRQAFASCAELQGFEK